MYECGLRTGSYTDSYTRVFSFSRIEEIRVYEYVYDYELGLGTGRRPGVCAVCFELRGLMSPS